MLIKAIEVGYLQTNCYIVADEATLDAAVIDPGADSNLILDYIERCHFHVRAILLTHGHFDHCMGLEEVYDATGATVYMSHADLTTDIGNGMFGNEDFELDPPDDTVFVREGDVIEAGSLTFDVLETHHLPLRGLSLHRRHALPHVLRPVRLPRQQLARSRPLARKAARPARRLRGLSRP